VGKKVGETGTVKDITHLTSFYKEVLTTGIAKREQIRLEHFDKIAYYDIYAEPIKDSQGQVTGLMSASTDITQIKQTEETLKSSKALLESVFSSMSEAVVVLDKAGNIINFNEAFATVNKFKNKQKVLRSISSFATLIKAYQLDGKPLPEEDWPAVKALQGQSGTNQEFLIERTDTGQRWISSNSYAPMRNDKGEIIGAVQTMHDITERKQLEQQLESYTNNLENLVEERTKKVQEAEQNYRELYESFGEAFIAIDWELNVIHWNKAAQRITNVAAKDALGKKVYEVLPEMMSVNVEPYYEALASKKPARFMMNTVSRETGRPSIFEISTYPAAQGIIIIVEDKTAEEETKRLSIIGATAGMVGHDIRNPLQAIVSDVYLLKDYLKTMPQMQTKEYVTESLEGIEKNVQYIDKIVADLQDYARSPSPEKKELDLNIICKKIVTKAVSENIKTLCNIDRRVEKIVSDPVFIERILTNLVTNAVQAMPKGGALQINANQKANQVIITVEDTGEGIPEEVKDKLFKPMFTTKSKGQGFGLVVVKRMTEALGGTITFESEIGKGTKFIVTLPSAP
jgi:PAS domain S-box-containing protein